MNVLQMFPNAIEILTKIAYYCHLHAMFGKHRTICIGFVFLVYQSLTVVSMKENVRMKKQKLSPHDTDRVDNPDQELDTLILTSLLEVVYFYFVFSTRKPHRHLMLLYQSRISTQLRWPGNNQICKSGLPLFVWKKGPFWKIETRY